MALRTKFNVGGIELKVLYSVHDISKKNDIVDELNNDKCKNNYSDNYISLLSTNDFVNIGNKNSYVINNEYFLLH